jgi:hypothetical protein
MDRRYLKKISRYVAERERIATQSLSELDVDDWFDYWHLHPDIKFKGNRVKPIFAQLTYKLLQQAEALTQHRSMSIQAWAVLDENTGYNAVYLHSANPNGSPFPRNFEEVEWGVAAPPEVEGIIKPSHEVGRAVYEEGPCYYIRRRT